jgi:hypothetical protein
MRRAPVIAGVALLFTACAHETRSADPTPVQASSTVTPGSLQQLGNLQRSANARKTPLAVYAFWREQLASAAPALQPLIEQVLAANLAELGAYEAAVLQFPYGIGALRTTPAPLPDAATHHAVPAAEAIAELARDRRIVIVNEAHHVAQTRLVTLALLPRLRALGYTHVALEGLDERDRDLGTRGYPTAASGIYVREPLYGEIVRQALALGFVVVPYESASADADSAMREREQAEHLFTRVFRAAPDARLFVHAGYAHVHHRGDYLEVEPMTLHLARMTGFAPLVIDQTVLRPSTPAREFGAYRTLLDRFPAHEPVLLRDAQGAAWSLEPALYDASVLLPPPQQHIVGRPDWLTLDGARTAVAVDLDLSAAHLPAVLEAHYAAEPDAAIPADRVLIEAGSGQVVLFLRPGEYRVTASDAGGHELFRRGLSVGTSTSP